METFDVVIIGGGISGLGIARETAQAGYSTLVLEAGRCGDATSNNSLRIIHGGFRYLQHLDLPRVLRSLRDQTTIINETPNALRHLPCLMPLTAFGLKSRIPVTFAALAYGAIMKATQSPLPPPCVIPSSTINSTVPILKDRAPHGALCWYDAVMTAPEAITDHLVTQARSNGAIIKEFTPALRVQGGAKSFTIHAKPGDAFNARCVVNSLGPWLGTLDLPKGLGGPRPLWCKGFNLIIKQQLDSTYGVGVQSGDGRLFFCVPRENGTAIGTWYFPHADASAPASVSEHEIAQFLHAFNAALPKAKVAKSDIVGVDVGILPMAKTSPKGPQLIAHERIHERDGYIEVMSTKYTTFRSQGKTVLSAVKRALA